MKIEKDLYEGPAIGGPFDGQELESRFPKGVVVTNVPDARVWIYDYVDTPEGGQFECRDRDSYLKGAQKLDQTKLAIAGEGNAYDVRAM